MKPYVITPIMSLQRRLQDFPLAAIRVIHQTVATRMEMRLDNEGMVQDRPVVWVNM